MSNDLNLMSDLSSGRHLGRLHLVERLSSMIRDVLTKRLNRLAEMLDGIDSLADAVDERSNGLLGHAGLEGGGRFVGGRGRSGGNVVRGCLLGPGGTCGLLSGWGGGSGGSFGLSGWHCDGS